MKSAVEAIIQRLGGAAKIKAECGWPLSTIHSWKDLGAIPMSRWPDLIALAGRLDVPLDTAELLAIAQARTADTRPCDTEQAAQ